MPEVGWVRHRRMNARCAFPAPTRTTALCLVPRVAGRLIFITLHVTNAPLIECGPFELTACFRRRREESLYGFQCTLFARFAELPLAQFLQWVLLGSHRIFIDQPRRERRHNLL